MSKEPGAIHAEQYGKADSTPRKRPGGLCGYTVKMHLSYFVGRAIRKMGASAAYWRKN